MMNCSPPCRPRWATPRRPDRPTWANPGRLAALERLLGVAFQPWQADTLAVAGEVDPSTGLLAYPTVGLSVGRQEGKSVLTDSVALLRSLARRYQRGAYVCQDRGIAADRLIELAEGRARRYVGHLRRSNGKERITFTNRSRWEIRAGTAKAGRGASLDTVIIDEAALLPFAVVDALAPTQAARPDPQLWLLSNAGDAAALMFWHYTELGRDAALADPGHGMAWFEWGADVDDDRADPATWARSMPALGSLITPRFVAAKLVELAREPDRFDREYLNRWPAGMGETDGVDLNAWAAAARPDLTATRAVTIGFDVAADRSSSSIALAGLASSGPVVVVDVVDRRPGTGWVAGAVRALKRAHRGARVVADDLTGASIVAELRAARVDVDALGPTDFARACGAFVDALDDGRIAHRSQGALDVAAAAAVRRRFGDAWAWSRTRSTGDIAPLCAVVVAAWGHWTRIPSPPPQLATAR